MKARDRENVKGPDVLAPAHLGIGSWIIVTALLVLLAGTFAIAYVGWRLAAGTDMPASGYVAMALGVLVSLAVGFGLMALLFYSSRKGYDEPPTLILSGSDGAPPSADTETFGESDRNADHMTHHSLDQ